MTIHQPRPVESRDPLLILIIPQSALETIPADLSAGMRGCEAVYQRGIYYVTVPAEVYCQWANAPLRDVPRKEPIK